MNKSFILVVENDTATRRLICTALETQNYRFHTADTAQNALIEVVSQKYDVMLLNPNLPDKDGTEIIKKVRSFSSVPIFVLSEKSDGKYISEILDLGADDYITVPFSTEELLARIRVILRRINNIPSPGGTHSSEFINGQLKIDFAAGCVYIGKDEIHLTPIEYKLLCLLAKNAGKVLTHSYITKEIWGDGWDNDISSLRVFMTNLRKKIEIAPDIKYIQTHVGTGYRMVII